MIKAKHVKSITITDPDTKLEVQVSIYKMETGAMVGVDDSFLANTDEPLYSPYDVGVEINTENL